jgi:hypothetical protein
MAFIDASNLPFDPGEERRGRETIGEKVSATGR